MVNKNMTMRELLEKLEQSDLIILDDWVMEIVKERPYTWKNIRGDDGINLKLSSIGMSLDSVVDIN